MKMLKKLAISLSLLSATALPALGDEPTAQPHEGAHEVAEHEVEGGEPPFGPHNAELFTWLTLFAPAEKQHAMRQSIVQLTGHDKTYKDKQPFVEQGQLTPLFMATIAFLLVILGGLMTRQQLKREKDAGVLPARKFGVFFLYEAVIGAVWNLMKGMMGAEEARKHFPIVGTLAFYIFTMNALAMIPGGAPATANLNTNIVMGLMVFLATHISGIRVQGIVGYAKHFMGPMLALAPLIVVVELISHLVRPLSLSLRLLGNMTGDHKVLEIFLGFHIPFLPLPLMFLGFMVVVIQTVVFVLLSTVYLSLAVEKHDHGDHGDHGHDAHAH